MVIDERNYEKAKFGTSTAWEQRKRNQRFPVRYSKVSAYPTPGNFECHNKFHFLILVKNPQENFRLAREAIFDIQGCLVPSKRI